MQQNYGQDWLSAAKEAFDTDLTPVQREIIEKIQLPGAWVSAIETDGMGRNKLYAIICATALLFKPELKIVLLTTDDSRIARVKSEIHSAFITLFGMQGIHTSWRSPLADTCVRLLRGKVDFITFTEGCEESLAGYFHQHSLYIVDNAALMHENAFKVLTGGMTEEDNRLLLLSEAHRGEGFFFHSQHKYKEQGLFHTVHSNANESRLMNQRWREEALEKFSPDDYRRRVLGRFPLTTNGVEVDPKGQKIPLTYNNLRYPNGPA